MKECKKKTWEDKIRSVAAHLPFSLVFFHSRRFDFWVFANHLQCTPICCRFGEGELMRIQGDYVTTPLSNANLEHAAFTFGLICTLNRINIEIVWRNPKFSIAIEYRLVNPAQRPLNRRHHQHSDNENNYQQTRDYH
jgi:hypothetical protein